MQSMQTGTYCAKIQLRGNFGADQASFQWTGSTVAVMHILNLGLPSRLAKLPFETVAPLFAWDEPKYLEGHL